MDPVEPLATDARQLFEALRDHEGTDAHSAVTQPWLDLAGAAYRAELAAAADLLSRPAPDGRDERRRHLLWELYALSRVSDLLLLAFQPPGDPAAPSGPTVTISQYLDLFTGLGMVSFDGRSAFDPFLHEIVEVEQAGDPDEPVRITDVMWPGLWLGPLLFSRAGVRVRAGVHHAERGVADRSPLYWAFLRRHRPTVDLSQGWGHNSQWRTAFRLDHRTAAGEVVNADGPDDIDDIDDIDDDLLGSLLTAAERRELVRHRCLVRTPVNADALAAEPDWQREFFPFDWSPS